MVVVEVRVGMEGVGEGGLSSSCRPVAYATYVYPRSFFMFSTLPSHVQA